MKSKAFVSKYLFIFSIGTYCLISPAFAATSYDGFRWFQVEMSIFTNEFPEDFNAEYSSPERLNLAYPDQIRTFAEFSDFFQIDDFESKLLGDSAQAATGDPLISDNEAIQLAVSQVGPFPAESPGDQKLPDLERDAYYLLPDSMSDFQTTNSRLEQSPTNRLLFHGLWRQPVLNERRATALLVEGGRQYGQHHELEGSITIRFNEGEDRVVIDADLWLSEFTQNSAEPNWTLPRAEGIDNAGNGNSQGSGYNISRISQMLQSRDMRSNEFHYLDHPSIGLVITVFPYNLPPAPPAFSADLQPIE